MAVSRSERRRDRKARVEAVFGREQAHGVLDLLELVEIAWHDCYGEITPPEDVVDDILSCSAGDLATLLQAARLAVEDVRDLKMWAEAVRARSTGAG
jgi:hypothetical protein